MAVTTAVRVLPIDPATYRRHPLHADDRPWTETNCYIDVWVELLHALGHEPLAAGCCALSADFLGDQWVFLKFPLEDLRRLYGLDVAEMNVWRPPLDHIVEQLAAGNLLTIEVDAFHLPDTAGVSHGIDHVKTTIVPNEVDRAGRWMRYFHNAGYFELSGDDFAGVFAPAVLPPYAELVRQGPEPTGSLVDRSRALVREHLARRPVDNPVARLADRVLADSDWLRVAGPASFHAYSFGTLRQCGLTAQLAADYLTWLGWAGGAAVAFTDVAEAAKTVQFQLARLSRGRDVDLRPGLASMTERWAAAMAALA